MIVRNPEVATQPLFFGKISEVNIFKKREDTHKMAEANKAFAHYRW